MSKMKLSSFSSTLMVDDMDKLLPKLGKEYAAEHKMSEELATVKLYQMLASTEKQGHGTTVKS